MPAKVVEGGDGELDTELRDDGALVIEVDSGSRIGVEKLYLYKTVNNFLNHNSLIK